VALPAIAFGQPDAACHGFPGNDLARGGDTFTVGDWTLVAGAWLATCAEGGVLRVACADQGSALTIHLSFPALDAPSYGVLFGDTVTTVLTTGPHGVTDSTITLGEVDVERLVPTLAEGGALRVTLAPHGAGAAAREVVFATAGFAEALPWLGCGDADTCPTRSCGP
jgi:hypothetical protein